MHGAQEINPIPNDDPGANQVQRVDRPLFFHPNQGVTIGADRDPVRMLVGAEKSSTWRLFARGHGSDRVRSSVGSRPSLVLVPSSRISDFPESSNRHPKAPKRLRALSGSWNRSRCASATSSACLKAPKPRSHAYASHTVWKNRAAFEAWTRSEAFRAAHHRVGENKPLYLGHPQFEGIEVRQTVGMGEAQVA
jgi:hypothetical protein